MSHSLASFYANSAENTNNSRKQPSNVCYTLPLTCQICLGKVKDPAVCPNLHAFCSFCIDIWLEKTKQCPTCRVAISNETPCRRILGGLDNTDDVDKLKPTEFSHAATRKARHHLLYQQYEDEIERLNAYIDSLNSDIDKLKNNSSTRNTNASSSPQKDMLQILKDKLQTTQQELENVTKDREALKEVNTKLDSENSILIQEINRLKAALNEKNSQISSRYTMAALESKLESYEKEIKRLHAALDHSDKYIADLESRSSSSSTSLSTFGAAATQKENLTINNDLIHNVTDSKSKMAVDLVTSPPPSSTSSSSSSIPLGNSTKKIGIGNDRFYGSPSKNSPNKYMTISVPVRKITPFGDRIKKTLEFSNVADFDAELNQAATSSYSSSNQFLSSPMKRLRLEESKAREKAGSTSNEIDDCMALLNEAEKKVQVESQHLKSPSSPANKPPQPRTSPTYKFSDFERQNFTSGAATSSLSNFGINKPPSYCSFKNFDTNNSMADSYLLTKNFLLKSPTREQHHQSLVSKSQNNVFASKSPNRYDISDSASKINSTYLGLTYSDLNSSTSINKSSNTINYFKSIDSSFQRK